MKRFVNGDEIELFDVEAEVLKLADRLMIRTPEGSFSAVVIRQGDTILVSFKGHQYRVDLRLVRHRAGSHSSSGELRAPMPGSIVDVKKHQGESVLKGETILVLEAMKTQQPFPSPFDGKVTKLLVAKGDQVTDGSLLAVVEPRGAPHE